MKNKAIVHLVTKMRMKEDVFSAEIDAMEDLNEKYGIQNVIFYKGDRIEYVDIFSKLEKFGIIIQNYSNKEDLLEKIADFNSEYEIIFVYTGLELLIKTANDVKVGLGHSITDNPNLFRNKFLQRQLIQENNPELGIKFMKGDPQDLDIKKIEKEIGYPFIIKPIDGVQSSGVEKILNKSAFKKYISNYEDFHSRLKSRGVDNKELIIEEFIDGNLYTLDYFVDEKGYIYISKPAREILGVDLKIDDYCVVARISSQDVEFNLKGIRLKTFVNSTVRACGIRNTFVHHEFKLTTKGKLKTIELNGRAGGGRVSLMKKAYDINLFEKVVKPSLRAGKLKKNNIVVNVYAHKRGILQGFNDKVVTSIKKRESVYNISLSEKFIGKEVGPTKYGFVKIGEVELTNRDSKQIEKDYNYIKSKYKSLLFIKSSSLSSEDDGILNKLKNYICN